MKYSTILAALGAVLSAQAYAGNTSILLDVAADGGSSYVHGYGAYIQVNYTADHAVDTISYCDNVQSSGGQPDTSRVRRGTPGYWCETFTLDELRAGEDLISLRNTAFLHIAAPGLDAVSGGEVDITFVKSVGITGLTRRVIKMQVSRPSGASDFTAALELPDGVETLDWLSISVSSFLGFPSGVSAVQAYENGQALPAIDLDNDLSSP
jgi:hypothetical protein